MGEAGCLKDGVFKNLQVNGNIDLENAISKSMPLRKTVVYDYNGIEADAVTVSTMIGADTGAANNDYEQVVKLPANAFVYRAYGIVKQVNIFSGGVFPTAGNISIRGAGLPGVGGLITLDPTLDFTKNEVHWSEVDTGDPGLTGDITIGVETITNTTPAAGADTWEQVGKIVIVLDYFIL